MEFDPGNYLPEDVGARLMAWDREPHRGPAILTEQPAKRLGHYFERLYECLIRDLIGWEILLKNQPIRSNGITLGELDFIVRNPADGGVEHHEIAVKFYLGHLDVGESLPRWYGPNARDRLDLKTDRLKSHQSQLTKHAETRHLLTSHGIETPVRPRIFMPGYLFYPSTHSLPEPKDVPPDHLRGHWLSINELDESANRAGVSPQSTQHWIPLNKPHWLGTWHQQHAPDPQETEKALDVIRSVHIPRLFAVLTPCTESRGWRETDRVFVVPGHWPSAIG